MVEVEPEVVEGVEFKWGKQLGTGGKEKKVHFYGSFTYDGVEYARYDSVYLYKEGEPEPYIGKLLKIWEHPNKEKKVKVLWFFRPCEISNFLGGQEPSDNELFLASGEGLGLCNINRLEAIAGKCNVICISKDSRNHQPTDEELQLADYVFHRTFDVENRKIMDEIEETIAGTDVKCLLNREDFDKSGREDFEKSSGTLKVDSGGKEVNESGVQNDDTVVKSEHNLSKECTAVKTNGHCTATSPNEAADKIILSTKHESSTAEKTISGVLEPDDVENKIQIMENVLGHKALSGCKVKPKHGGGKVGKVLVRQVESEVKVECAKDSIELDERPSKKAKLSSEYVEKSKNSMQHTIFNSDANDGEIFSPTTSALKPFKDPMEKGPSKKLKPGDKTTMLSNGKLIKEPSHKSYNEDYKTDGRKLEVTPSPHADRRKWFKGLPWEDSMRTACEQGKLVLLQNLDPSYTSAEVEDIVWHGFKEKCTAKMIQRTAFSSPHSGEAFVIFRKRETAEMVIKELNESCLLLSNGRPLVGSLGVPCFPEKKPTLFGHFVIEKLRYQMQRAHKDAVSTSHCPQPNTIEFDMAMEWCLRQEKSELMWKKLYQKQGDELKKLKAKLKAR